MPRKACRSCPIYCIRTAGCCGSACSSSSASTTFLPASSAGCVPDEIQIPHLRAESSDLLLPDVADEMRKRGPRAELVTIAGCGHPPALNVPDQLNLVER